MDCRKKTGNTKLIIKKIHKNRVEKKSRSTKEKLNIIDIRRVVKNKNKVPLKKYLETNKFLFGSDDDTEDCVIKNNEKEVLKEQHVKISQPQGTIQSTLIVKSAQGAATNSETSTNTKTIPRTDDKNGEQFINSVRSESGPDINDKAVSEKVDATGGKCGNCLPTEIDKGNATIICTETEAKGNVNAIQFEEIPLTGFEAPVQDGFSGFQREYIIYNEITENVVLAEKSAGQQLKCKSPTIDDNEKPLDLSFNKSTEFTDIQFEEISDLLSTNALHAQTTTELIVEEFDKLLEQQSNATSTNPTNFSDSEHLQNSESIGENQLPPFSKFFKNNANSLKSNDGFMTQSTPKQKTIGQNTIIKRVSQQNLDKENKPSKRKKKVNFVENSAETNTTQKSSIEILSVDIIMPSEGTTSLPLNLHNSNETTTDSPESKPITKGGDNSELTNDEVRVEESTCYHRTSGSIIEDLIPYVKIKKPTVAVPSCGSRVAADSTSEQQPVAFLNEIDYAPEDTLNQLKLECMDDENNLFHSTLQSSANLTASFLSEDHNSTSDESMLLSFSDEDRENYKLLRSTGLQIVMTPNVEDDLCLYKTEEMRTKANCFAKIYCEFKYLWKVGNGVKSYEQIELNFSKLMQRLNEHYKFELSIAQTKRIVNLVSLWYMQTYHRWFIEKKRTSTPILYYLQIFAYLPKTSRRIFYCEECPRYFLSQQKFLTHRRGHVGVPPTCATCQTTYASRGELQLHTNQCATFKCIECDSEFKSAADLEYHLRNNHMFQCEKCGKLCATAADLDWHEHQYPIICGLCNRFYDTALELQKHRQNSFHWDYTCRTCEVFLPTATLMKQHLKLCNGNTNACPI
ncbi:uncharacterized protein LOC105665545 [Ceratitis capitata]|uniref:uncharacterized protein LOC105665545 n=1 Tax=Ceratitis capitata TaxID=7213 RepID=UPI000A0FC825|nr:uncharacterized protein LOC105665545 [Ceratitis capitata]